MRQILIQLAVIVAIVLGGCEEPKFPTPAKCKAAVMLELDAVSDELCPDGWDDCEFRESIMESMDEKFEDCNAIR